MQKFIKMVPYEQQMAHKIPQTRQAIPLTDLPGDLEQEVYSTDASDTIPDRMESSVQEQLSENEEDAPRPRAFITRKMPIISQPVSNLLLFEELRNKLRTPEGKLEATVLAVEIGLATKPIDVHRAMTHLEKQGLVDRAADIAFRVENYKEAAAIYERANRYVEAGSTCEVAQDLMDAAYFYIRAACTQEDIPRGQRYLQRGSDLLCGRAKQLHIPKEAFQQPMPPRKQRIAMQETALTDCTSIGAERRGLFAEAANFARRERNLEMAGVYRRLSTLVERILSK